jgi:hypothetical protein
MSALPALPVRMRRVLAMSMAWAGAVAWALGMVQHRLWEQLPLGRLAESLALAGLVALLAMPLVRWREWSWAAASAAIWVAAAVLMAGLLPSLAVALLLASAVGIGSVVTGPRQPLFAPLVGLAILAATVGWLLPLPVHHWWVYLPLQLGVVIWRHRQIRVQAAAALAGWRAAIAMNRRAAAIAVMALGMASTGTWLPTMQHDDLAYHLGLPWQLVLHGRYALDPTHQVWALAPWAGDVLQAIPQVSARTEARGPLNLAWLLATSAGSWLLGRAIGLAPAFRWGTLALVASLPMTASLLGGMQTEVPATAVLVALAVLVIGRRNGQSRTARLASGAILLGMLFALKPIHGVAALPLLAIAACRVRWRDPSVLATIAVAGSLFVAVAGSSYVYAWSIAGNPVLPLFNDIFGSPYFAPTRFSDARWASGLGPDMLWSLTFSTDQWLEAWPGGAGFVQVLLAGPWLLALATSSARRLAIAGSLAILIPLAVVQYGRYLHPGMVLLVPALALALQHWLPRRHALALLVLACLANFTYQANAHWFLRTGAVKWSVLALTRDEPLFERYVPERLAAAAIRESSVRTGAVLFLHVPAHAELAGPGRTVSWYAPGLNSASSIAANDQQGHGWQAFLDTHDIGDVVLRPDALTPAQRAGLALAGAERVAGFGEVEWWRIPGHDDP